MEWFGTMNEIKQKRAKAGGEIGPNGESYKGGAFIATTKKAKGAVKKWKPSHTEIEKGVYVESRENQVSIYRQLSGVEIFIEGEFRFNNDLRGDWQIPAVVKSRRAMINAFNSGMRWKIIGADSFTA